MIIDNLPEPWFVLFMILGGLGTVISVGLFILMATESDAEPHIKLPVMIGCVLFVIFYGGLAGKFQTHKESTELYRSTPVVYDLKTKIILVDTTFGRVHQIYDASKISDIRKIKPVIVVNELENVVGWTYKTTVSVIGDSL